jgi:hypothetical protein
MLPVAFCGVALAASACGAAKLSPYTLVATRSCLMSLPNAVSGLPPTRPPVPSALFVYALAHDDLATGGVVGPRPRAHKQLGAWYGGKRYQGVILSFFKSVPDARVSLEYLASLYGGERIRNVVATWDLDAPWPQKPAPSQSLRSTIVGCLRSGDAGIPRAAPTRSAALATFAGGWGGHGRGLAITSSGRGSEGANDGCCTRVYQMTFQILSVNGTLTRATAVYRVTSFRRYESGVTRRRGGDVGKLLLRNGIVTNTLTGDFFCSVPAWGATGACGA